jgi:hypothetical protein
MWVSAGIAGSVGIIYIKKELCRQGIDITIKIQNGVRCHI